MYEKGAEVIRMIQYWLGKKEFTKGGKHYFSKHDGQAVRIDDFVQAVFEVNNVKDYQQFMQWYDAAGTPKINVKETFTAATGELEIELQQEIPQVRNHQAMHPFHIPIHIGFLDPAGKEVDCDGADQFRNSDQQMILHLKHSQQKWKFQFPQLKETRGPVISYLRGFCAPVYFHGNQSRDQRLHLALNDSDLFNRIWALQSLYIEDIIAHYQSGSNVYQLDSEIKNCLQRTLLNPQLDAAIKAGMMTMPPLSLILEKLTDVDVNKLANVLTLCEKEIGIALTGELDELYRKLWEGDRKALDAKSISERALKDRCLALLATTESRVAQKYVLQQFAHARHFNDEYTALEVAMNFDWNETLTMSEDFIRKHHEQYLTRLSWFGLVAQSNRKDTLTLVQQAAGSPYFDRKNPAASLKLLRLYGENFFQSYRNNCEGLLYVLDGIVQMDQFNSLAAARH
ncbi:MAG TPA: DUF3458 domain-containing protein, partial [Pseudobdellovibrionaceae bacterium]|nr:DUF3458 domain-containing protein [Pseudobdellovibrionaceae bacterium]